MSDSLEIVHEIWFITGKVPPNGKGIAQFSKAVSLALENADFEKYKIYMNSNAGGEPGSMRWTVQIQERPEEAVGAIYHALKDHIIPPKKHQKWVNGGRR